MKNILKRWWNGKTDLSESPPIPELSASPPPVLQNEGYCPTCDRTVTFTAYETWLRDHYCCSNCGSIPRERALMLCIERFFPQWREFRIHESSPGNRGASVKLASQSFSYIGSHYFPDTPLGATHSSGWRNENLEDQTFADESFDLVVTQDVMEHIFHPDRAFQEIARTLKPGGAHVFTVPIVRKHQPSQIRASLGDDGQPVHLFPPEYHGNPIDGSGSLVTMHWGYDICDYIQQCSGLSTTMVYIDDLSHGIRAEYIEVLVSRKPATPNAPALG